MPEAEDLVEQQLEQQRRHPVALGLGGGLQIVERMPFDPRHHQNVRGAQLGDHLGQREVRVIGEQAAVMLQVGGLLEVVGLVVELALGLVEQRRDVEAGRQQARDAQQRRHVVHVAGDAAGDARVLHLDRQPAAVEGLGRMHLADRGRRHRGERELAEGARPVLAPGGLQHLHQLAHGHRLGICAQAGEDLGQLGGQQVAGVHRQELPDLHRRAAQVGQLLGHPAGVGGGEEQVAHRGAAALGELAQPLGEHPAGDARGQAAQPGEARDAAARHRRARFDGRRCHGGHPRRRVPSS